jgi:hypothetical protein
LDQTLRIDYFHTGDAKNEEIIVDNMYIEGTWAGHPQYCIQPFELGLYKVIVKDIQTNQLIYSKGYNSIFAEYQTIDPAIRGIKRTFHESVLIPLPKRPCIVSIEKRDRNNSLSSIFELTIDPADYHILKQKVGSSNDEIIPFLHSGHPQQKVDMVILAEGYQVSENRKFKTDLEFFGQVFLSIEPYKSRAEQFNITGIFSASEESGNDEPRQRIYKKTRLSSSFNYFELDRYCLADDNRSIRDVASGVPYDVILIMVNSDRYGGGGIYNCQTLFTSGSEYREYVFLHEFGHGFAGLGDEYFSSSVTYVDVFTLGVEPLEANITSLPDPEKVKWQQYLSPGIAVPTEWGKATYDSLTALRGKIVTDGDSLISKLRNSGASMALIDQKRKEIRTNADAVNKAILDFFTEHPMKDKVGVFEGASYVSEGLYRPTIMSLMHGYEDNPSYDAVNEQAIISTIQYYTGE